MEWKISREDAAALFESLHPDFFSQPNIRALPEGCVCDEMILPLSAFDPRAYERTPDGDVRFGVYEGDPAALRQAVAEVLPDWLRFFDGRQRAYCGMADGRVVSFCLIEDMGVHTIGGRPSRIGGPGCVGTVPAYRDRGIGLNMVKNVTRILRDEGYDYSYIHYTGVAPWYAKLGYRTILRWSGRGVLPDFAGETEGKRVITAYHVVTDRPLRPGQVILFDETHHSGVWQRVQEKKSAVEEIYAHPERYDPETLEHHTSVALRELAMEDVRVRKYPGYPSRMSCLYVTETLREAEDWAGYFSEIGRPTYSIVRLEIEGRCFTGDAANCFDGRTDRAENEALAERYWANEPNEEGLPPIRETLADGKITVADIVREINANVG